MPGPPRNDDDTAHSRADAALSRPPEDRGVLLAGAMDPGLQDQFERARPLVRSEPETTPRADALQRPHYEPGA